ncbi:MAG: ATPase, T2SS/T4P/T4SS family [Acutalibacteraceae bacterium]
MKNNECIKLKNFENAISSLSENIAFIFKNISDDIKISAREIRLRINSPLMIVCDNKSYFIDSAGNAVDFFDEKRQLFMITSEELSCAFEKICNYSIYSFENEIKNGFITVRGGHRIGIAGEVVIFNGKITGMRNISSLNIRIAGEFVDCSKNVFDNIKFQAGGALIAGPPSSGKTTFLRDLALKFSTSSLLGFPKVSIIDERCEIAAFSKNEFYMNIGFSDVLSLMPKAEGILQATRCLSPDIIIIDEIGTKEEAKSAAEAFNSGVRIISSVHASDLKELLNKPQTQILLSSKAFETIVILSESFSKPRIYKVSDIYDKNNRICNCGDVRRFRRIGGTRKTI